MLFAESSLHISVIQISEDKIQDKIRVMGVLTFYRKPLTNTKAFDTLNKRYLTLVPL